MGDEPGKKADERENCDRQRRRRARAQLRSGWNVNKDCVQALLREVERLGENDNQHNDRRQEKESAVVRYGFETPDCACSGGQG